MLVIQAEKSHLIKKPFLPKGLRAKDESRTRDLNLGKVALYQLSYFRISELFCDSLITFWL